MKREPQLIHIGEQIRQARERAGLTQQQVADALRCSKQLISHAENARSELSRRHMTELSKLLVVPIGILLGTETLPVSRDVPLSPVVMPGQVGMLVEGRLDRGAITVWRDRMVGGENSIWIQVTDNACAPDVSRGDLALVDPDSSPGAGDLVAVHLRAPDIIVVRRLKPSQAGSISPPYTLIAGSPFEPEIVVSDANKVEWLGAVREIRRIIS